MKRITLFLLLATASAFVLLSACNSNSTTQPELRVVVTYKGIEDRSLIQSYDSNVIKGNNYESRSYTFLPKDGYKLVGTATIGSGKKVSVVVNSESGWKVVFNGETETQKYGVAYKKIF